MTPPPSPSIPPVEVAAAQVHPPAQTARRVRSHASEQTGRTGTPDSRSHFPASASIEDIYAIILSELERHEQVFAAVHYRNGDKAEPAHLTKVRLDLSVDGLKSLANQLVSICQQSSENGLLCNRRLLSPDRIILGVPIAVGDGRHDCFAIVASVTGDPTTIVRAAENLIRELALWLLHQKLRFNAELASHSAALLELASKALHAKTRSHACQIIATELSDHLRLRRLAIGCQSDRTHRCRLLSLSDATRVDADTPQIRLIEAAMDESLMFGQSITANPDSAETSIGRASQNLAADQSSRVIAVPLLPEDEFSDDPGGPDKCSRAALVAFVDGNQSTEEVGRFLRAAAPCLHAVLESWNGRSTGHVARAISKLRARAGLLMLGVAIMTFAAMFVPVEHRETCSVRIEPNQKRFIAAPFDSTLEDCHVTPGDFVREGTLLATLDGRELRWKREGIHADHDQARKKRDAAQASGKFADARIAQLEADRLQSELSLLDLRLTALEIRSPVDGIIVTGDLRRATGAPLDTGQSLFEIAPMEEALVEIAIPDDAISHIRPDQQGTLRLNAYPDHTWDVKVASVNPRSEIRDEENVFIGECVLLNGDQRLRPGMKGKIKIECGKRHLGWVLFHRPYEAVQQWVWW